MMNARISRTLLAFASVVTLSTVATPTVEAARQSWFGTVVAVLDGDTFNVQLDGQNTVRTVRVAGLNTNERWVDDPTRSAECHANDAWNALDDLIGGKRVRLEAQDAGSINRGRDIRHVFTSGGDNVGIEMLEDGWGVPIRFPEEPDFADEYAQAARVAIRNNLGIWDDNDCGSGPASNAEIEMVVNYDAAGDDGDNVNGEWVQIRNRGTQTIDLTGWQIRDSAIDRWTFPNGRTLAPGGRLRIHVGNGTNTSTNLYMGFSGALLSNTADGIFLHDTDFDIRAYRFWPCGGSCDQIPMLVIDAVNPNAPGDDGSNPNGEWIRIRNISGSTIDLQDWMIESPPYQMTSIASRPIAPNGTLTVYVGKGTNTTSKMYWGQSSGILNNGGDTVRLHTPARDIADCADWGSGDCPSQAIGARIDMTVNWDAAGNDVTNPNGEWVNLTNRSDSTISLTGFSLSSPPYEYDFPSGTSISPGSRVRVKVGSGSNSSTTKYWGRSSGILNNGGDLVSLLDPSGNPVRTFEWPCATVCGPPPPPLVIDEVRYNAPGDDTKNPNGEVIRIRNVSSEVIDTRDWQILSPPYQINPSASRRLDPGEVMTIYVGKGTNTSTRLYWGKSSGILNNGGDQVQLWSPARDLADCVSWGSSSCSSTVGRAGQVAISVNADAEGNDSSNPNGEWINITNLRNRSINIGGYQIVNPGQTYTIPSGTTLAPGVRFRLFAGSGSNSTLTRYGGWSSGILANSADTVSVLDPSGVEVRHFEWPCSGSCGPIADVEIASVTFDASGDDSTNPNGERIVIRNDGPYNVNLRDWKVYSWPYLYDISAPTTLSPGSSLTLRIGSGTDTSSTRYWGKSSGILDNGGDVVELITPYGDRADCADWGNRNC